MAIKLFNSVAGFSVGETPANIILGNGDVTTNNFTTTGVANLNAIGNVKITGGSAGQVISTDGLGNLSFSTISSDTLANGTSNIKVLNSANITFSSAGTANVMVITSTGVNVSGTLNATGNVTGGNLITAGNVFAPAIISNGTYNTKIELGAASGIIAITTDGNSTQFGPSGTITLGGASQIIGGTFGGSGITLGGSQTDIFQSRGGNVTVQVGAGGTIANTWTFAQDGSLSTPGLINATGNISGANLTTAGVLSVTGNANVGNLGTVGLIVATGNITSSANLVSDNIIGRTGALTITSAGTNTNINLKPNGTGNIDANAAYITNVKEPFNPQDAATKYYVDQIAQGLHTHDACQAATPDTLANITSGTVTYNNGISGVGANLTTTGAFNLIDTVNVQTSGTRILVKNEANTTHNGIYVWSNATVITRADDFDTPAEMAGGDFTFVQGGFVYDNTGWVMPDAVTTVGTSPVVWVQFSGAGTYTAGTGLTLLGTVFSITDTTVTPASYGNGDSVATFTVNQQGQLTAAANAVITANAANLTGTTLASGIINSSLTSVGTLTSLAVTGNVTAANFVGRLANGNSNVSIPAANGNVTISAVGNANILVITGSGVNVFGTFSTGTGNANVGNLGTAQVLATANVTAPQLISNVAIGTAPLVVTSTTVVANLNANALQGSTPASANTGSTIALRDASGNLSANFFIGDGSQLTGIGSAGSIANGTSNVSIPAVNGNVNTSVGGTSNVLVVTATGANITGTANVTGNLSAGNISATNSNVSVANVSGNVILGNSTVTTTVTWDSATTTSITANQTIASFSVSGVTGVEFLVKGIDATGSKYSVATVQAVTDGTSVDYSTFGTVNLGGYTGSLAVNIVAGDIRLQVTPASANSTLWTTQYRLV